MMNIENILYRNNEGVQLLHSGRYQSAKKAFRDALSQLNALSQKHTSYSECELVYPLIIKTQLIPFSAPNNTYLYRNALVADLDRKSLRYENNKASSRHSNNESFRPSAAIVYNLTLAHHFCIMGSQVRSERRLKHLLAMYEKVLGSLYLKPLSERKNMTAEYLVRESTFLGILNNLGVLNHEFHDYQHAEFCFETLRSLLNSASRTILGNDAFKGMLTNVLLLEDPKVAQAA